MMLTLFVFETAASEINDLDRALGRVFEEDVLTATGEVS